MNTLKFVHNIDEYIRLPIGHSELYSDFRKYIRDLYIEELCKLYCGKAAYKRGFYIGIIENFGYNDAIFYLKTIDRRAYTLIQIQIKD